MNIWISIEFWLAFLFKSFSREIHRKWCIYWVVVAGGCLCSNWWHPRAMGRPRASDKSRPSLNWFLHAYATFIYNVCHDHDPVAWVYWLFQLEIIRWDGKHNQYLNMYNYICMYIYIYLQMYIQQCSCVQEIFSSSTKHEPGNPNHHQFELASKPFW